MQTGRRLFVGALLSGAAGVALDGALAPAAAQQRAAQEGTEYRPVKPPQPTEAPTGKIEVVEFFWYGCPHCNALEPLLEDWVKKQPADVQFRKVHVPFQEVKHQQLYYALDALGKAPELNRKVFQAIHVERNRLNTAELMVPFVEKNGIDRKAFIDAFNSFAVQTKMKRASQLAEGYGVDGVPAFGVAGRWYTAPSMVGSNAATLALVDTLVERERAGARK